MNSQAKGDRLSKAENTCDRDIRLENFAAELTSAVYPLVLRRGLKDSWLQVELFLWRTLADTVRKWLRQRPPDASEDVLDAWRERLLVDLTELAFYVSLKHGVKESLLELASGMYVAVRPVIWRYSRVR